MHRSPRPDGKVVVSSGTVDELIQQLATDQMPGTRRRLVHGRLNIISDTIPADKEYLEHFLLSHPYFLDSVELLTKLLDRYVSLSCGALRHSLLHFDLHPRTDHHVR